MATSPPLGSSPVLTVSVWPWPSSPCGLNLAPLRRHLSTRRCFREFNISTTVTAPSLYVVSQLLARAAKTTSRSLKSRTCCTSAVIPLRRRPSQSTSRMTNPAVGFPALTITHPLHLASPTPSPSHAAEFAFTAALPLAFSTLCKPCANSSKNPPTAHNYH